MPFFLDHFLFDEDMAIYGHWEARNMDASRFDVCFTRSQFESLRDELPEVAHSTAIDLQKLPIESDRIAISIRGRAATIFCHIIHQMLTEGRAVKVPKPTTTGTWGPTQLGPNNPGVIMWVDEELAHHTCLVYSKKAANSVVYRLRSWATSALRHELLQMVKDWHLPDDSERATEEIDGPAAKMLGMAGMYEQGKNLRRRLLN